jgi:hypothetical protein
MKLAAVKHIEINFRDSFAKTCGAVVGLPEGRYGRSARSETVAEALRYLYIAAHGRTLKTSIGPVTIMRATDPYLTDASFSLVTRSDLLSLAGQKTAFPRRAGRNGDGFALQVNGGHGAVQQRNSADVSVQRTTSCKPSSRNRITLRKK